MTDRPTLADWMRETRATLSLAWPLVLTQLAQIALSTVDVLLLGRLGPEALASGALAVNLYNAFMLFGVGVMTATMAMVARERGRMAHSVREIRRTFHQALWVAATPRAADLVRVVAGRGDPRPARPGSGAGASGGVDPPRADVVAAALLRLRRPARLHGGDGTAAVDAGDRPSRRAGRRRRRLGPDLRQLGRAAPRRGRRRLGDARRDQLHVRHARPGDRRRSALRPLPSLRPRLALRRGALARVPPPRSADRPDGRLRDDDLQRRRLPRRPLRHGDARRPRGDAADRLGRLHGAARRVAGLDGARRHRLRPQRSAAASSSPAGPRSASSSPAWRRPRRSWSPCRTG